MRALQSFDFSCGREHQRSADYRSVDTAVLKSNLSEFEAVEFEIQLLNARIERARKHYAEFGEVWAEYLSDRPHSLEHTSEEDGTVAVRLQRTVPLPVALSISFGEFLYELRAALDNCLYAAAVLVSGQNPPPSAKRLEWPIRLTHKEWKDQAKRYQDLPPELVTALEAIQPYHAELPGWNSLGLLHDLARVDRHRSPHGLGLYLAHLRLVVDQSRIEVINFSQAQFIDQGDELVRLRVSQGTMLSPENFDLELEFDVDVTDVPAVAGPSGAIGRPWGSLNKRMRSLVRAVDEYTTALISLAIEHRG